MNPANRRTPEPLLRRLTNTASGLLLGLACASAAATPLGQLPKTPALRSGATAATAAAPGFASGLRNVVTAVGNVYLSTDGIGSNTAAITLRIDKRSATSTVRSAHLLIASAGFSEHVPTDADLVLNGVAVNLDDASSVATRVFANNAVADVTAIVRPLVDAAAPGLVPITLVETAPELIDGAVLAVVFDDPTQPDGSVLLYSGANTPGVNRLNVQLSAPIVRAIPSRQIDLGLGIAFGAQDNTDATQYTTVAANGTRISTAAGGQDDGALELGALLTVGGLGDDRANPPQPFAFGQSCGFAPRCDDEFYNLETVLADGSSIATIELNNETADDNLFFAAIATRGTRAAAIDERLDLVPGEQTVNVGDTAVIDAQLVTPIAASRLGRAITLDLVNGPEAPFTATVTTDALGMARFGIPCTQAGLNFVIGRYTDLGGINEDSIPASFRCQRRETQLTAAPGGLRLGPGLRLSLRVSARLETIDPLTPVAGESLRFTTRNGNLICEAVTGADGIATCTGAGSLLQATLSLGYRVDYGGNAALGSSNASGGVLSIGNR